MGVSLLAGLVTFYFPSAVRQRWNPVLVFDAAGLALCAVSGAQKALVFAPAIGRCHPMTTSFFGHDNPMKRAHER